MTQERLAARDRGRWWLGEVESRLRPLVEGAEPAAGDRSSRIDIDNWAVRVASRCPASLLAPAEPFRESIRTVRRRIGLAALGEVSDDEAGSARSAVRRVLRPDPAQPAAGAGVPENLLEWFRTLPTPAKTAVAESAAAWVTEAVAAVGWADLRAWSWVDPAGNSLRDIGRVRIKGRIEARTSPAVDPTSEIVLLSGGSPDRDAMAVDAGHALLAVTLNTTRTPRAAVVVHTPSRTRIRVGCDDQHLATALDLVVTAVEAKLAAEGDGRVTAIPGNRCHTCALSERCDEGATWIRTVPRVYGGLVRRDVAQC